MPAQSLLEESNLFKGNLAGAPLVMKPVHDDFASNPFLPLDPLDALKAGDFNKVPTIMGWNRNEGLVALVGFIQKPEQYDKLKENWEEHISMLLLYR